MEKVRVGRERGVRGRCDRDMVAADADAGAGAGRVFFSLFFWKLPLEYFK